MHCILCRLDMVHMPGKGAGGRRVPLILTSDVLPAMEAMVRTRSMCGIPSSNMYFFAVPYTDSHVSGWQAMDRVSNSAGLDEPQLIHSTRLRKYAATVTQVGLSLVCLCINVSIFTYFVICCMSSTSSWYMFALQPPLGCM